MSRLLTRNPLAFPTGAAPRINPNHRAANNVRFSGTPRGNNYVNLLTGKPGTLTLNSGAINAFNHGLLGPCVNVPSYFMQQQSVFDPIPYAAGEAFTIGGFVSQTIPAGDTGVFANNGGGANSVGAFASVSNNQFKLNFVGVIYIGPTGQAFFPVNYHSYFYAVSWVKSVDYCNIVSIDLVTGQIVTEVMGTGGFNTLGGTGGASCFGPGSQNGMDGFYGPHMWSSTFMSMKELVAWACDPWAFWYPNA